MRVGVIMMSAVLVCAIPQASRAQVSTPSENTVAIGGDVGFLGSGADSLDGGTGHVDAFVEYYYTSRSSLRGMYGWARPEFQAASGRSLRRQHVTLNYVYNWQVHRFRPFATIGGGAYFLHRREGGESLGEGVTRPGANVGLGVEYYLRTFAIKSEMNVHILSNDKHFAELDGATLSAFTWTFGLKVPF